jgi:ankyrin repeat protein
MTPNDNTQDEDLLARYRQASADTAGPSDAVREAILAESRRVAAELAKQTPRPPVDVSRPAANDSRWKIPAFGTVGVALLAALLFAPRYWENAPPAQVSMAPPSAPASTAAQAQTKNEAPKMEEVKPYAAPSNAAPAPNPGAPAPALPPSVAQNYAPGSSSVSRLAGQGVVGGMTSKSADRAASADSALKPATLQSAVAHADVAQAASLLDQGAVIDARDEAGRTPLMLAVTENRLEIVRLLLARGADPNAADNTGRTPLQQATKRNLQEVAALLQQAGAH